MMASMNSSPDFATVTEALAAWLEGGDRRVGELVIRRGADGWEVRHERDAAAEAAVLTTYGEPEAAREIAKYDESGGYRPLKGAPTLIRGWRLVVPGVDGLRAALDFFYPAAVGNWVAFTAGRVMPVPMKATLARQTGMYRITGLLDDDDCRAVVATTCDFATACRRRIAWSIAPGIPLDHMPPEKTNTSPAPDELPILCLEACNFLVAAARTHIKQKRSAGSR